MRRFWDWLLDLLEDDPIYAPTQDTRTEGWLFALEQEKTKTRLAESKLKALDGLADGIIEYNWCPQYGRDIKSVLSMTQAELDENYGD